MYFPFSDYWSFYLIFSAFVVGLLTLDLGVFHKKSHEISFKEASAWTAVWVSLALIFNYALSHYAAAKFGPEVGKQISLEFLTGFVVEKALAVDNLFVFMLIFSYFKIPRIMQHRVLFFGIIGALIFRAIFIALGSILMQYQWVVIIFGIFLIFTGIKMLWGGDEEEDLSNNKAIKLLRRIIPTSHKLEADHFFTMENGKKVATPLFVALLVLEFSDIVFAVDSVPAIFALTKEPFIVFTSNIFAILGLRSMFFMLGGIMEKFVYLKYGLAFVLMFVGLKMTYLNQLFNGHFPISWSLGIITLLIGGSIGISLLFPPKEK